MWLELLLAIVVVPILLLVIFAFKQYLRHPEKNFKNAMIEVGLYPMRLARLGPYSSGKLDLNRSVLAAVKKTKLSDFDGTQFVENYRLVMNGEDYKKQRFSNVGYISAKVELYITWVRRLRLVQYLKENPEILDVPVTSPIFVMGLPRTGISLSTHTVSQSFLSKCCFLVASCAGTTFLYRLLSLDPQHRAPLLWELLYPVPTVPPSASSDAKDRDRKKRIKHIKELIDHRRGLGDHALDHIHEIGE